MRLKAQSRLQDNVEHAPIIEKMQICTRHHAANVSHKLEMVRLYNNINIRTDRARLEKNEIKRTH